MTYRILFIREYKFPNTTQTFLPGDNADVTIDVVNTLVANGTATLVGNSLANTVQPHVTDTADRLLTRLGSQPFFKATLDPS